MTDMKPGMIVQIDPQAHPKFAACLLIVTEVHPWGVIGYVPVPDAPAPGLAYLRVAHGDFVLVGEAHWLCVPEGEKA